MAAWTKKDLKQVLQEDFIENWDAWSAGRRNDDMVDSMCICFALTGGLFFGRIPRR